MKFQITDGLDLLAIGLCHTGNYLRYKKPLSVVWYDRGGAKYLCIMPYSPEYRAAIRENIVGNFNVDYTDQLAELHQLLSPLLKLFPNGAYELKYHTEGEYEFSRPIITVEYAPNEFYTFYQHHTALQIIDATNAKDFEHKIKEHNEHKKECKKWGTPCRDIIDYTTAIHYEPNSIHLVATQPLSAIDQDRVKYFEAEIKKGKHPFVIIFNVYIPNQYPLGYNNSHSDHFVLDGHHKLIAYQNVGKLPTLVEITHFPESEVDLEFDLELLSEVLYPWQFEDIKRHCL